MKLSASEAAAEAVIGCFINQLRGGGDPKAFTVDQEHVRNWLHVVFSGNTTLVAPAMAHAVRMLAGKAKPV